MVKGEQSEGVFVNIGDLTIEELSNGYVNTGDTYACIFCKETFDAQEEFKIVIDFIQLNIQFHIEQEYGEALVQLDKRLTDYQISKRNCLSYLHRGIS